MPIGWEQSARFVAAALPDGSDGSGGSNSSDQFLLVLVLLTVLISF
jgi:hypothetical protein